MDTTNLHPLQDGKTPRHGVDGKLGVYYVGQWVEVIEVNGAFYTQISVEELAAQTQASNPSWEWTARDVAATKFAKKWPVRPVDPDTRTYRGMVSATYHERRGRLLSNDRPLPLLPEDERSLLEEIRLATAQVEEAELVGAS